MSMGTGEGKLILIIMIIDDDDEDDDVMDDDDDDDDDDVMDDNDDDDFSLGQVELISQIHKYPQPNFIIIIINGTLILGL